MDYEGITATSNYLVVACIVSNDNGKRIVRMESDSNTSAAMECWIYGTLKVLDRSHNSMYIKKGLPNKLKDRS